MSKVIGILVIIVLLVIWVRWISKNEQKAWSTPCEPVEILSVDEYKVICK